MNILTKMIIGFIALIGSVAVIADDNNNDQWLLAKYDVNGDQVISVNEIEDKRQRMFASMDSDANGGVSFDEYESLDKQRRQVILQARFNKLDLDRDGHLSGAEYSSYLGSFDRMDQNGDGRISQREINSKVAASKNTVKVKPDADICLLWLCVRKNMR
ncbi:MAG: Ca2+-binding EF-hand superfamily protein [Flavobacteriales bacterium]|jgi:Ca2+-binding EF-hand superfamily protein